MNYFFDVDSSYKITGTDADFTIKIPGLTSGTYDRVSLVGITFNKSYYNCPTAHSYFYVNGILVSLTPQNYSIAANSICAELKSKLDALGLGTWTITGNTSKASITFATTYGSALTFTFPDDQVLARLFGVPLTFTFTTTYTSPYTVDFQRTTAIYLASNVGIVQNEKSVIYTIHPVGVSFTQVSSINANMEASAMRLLPSSDTFFFRVYDDNFNVMDLRNNQVIITLCFFPRKVGTFEEGARLDEFAPGAK